MPCNPMSAQDEKKAVKRINLDDLEWRLFVAHHVAGLLGDFANQGPRDNFSDGLPMERYAVVFGWLSKEIGEARDTVLELYEEIAQCK